MYYLFRFNQTFLSWRRKLHPWWTQFKSFIDSKTLKPRIVFCSLFYNYHLDSVYIVDTLMEPLFCFVYSFTKILGPFFVTTVILLISVYVIIAYLIGVPFYWHQSKIVLTLALIIGNYILINVIFHYYMALTTSPGNPPQVRWEFYFINHEY